MLVKTIALRGLLLAAATAAIIGPPTAGGGTVGGQLAICKRVRALPGAGPRKIRGATAPPPARQPSPPAPVAPPPGPRAATVAPPTSVAPPAIVPMEPLPL